MDQRALYFLASKRNNRKNLDEFSNTYEKLRVLGRGAYGTAYLVRRKGHKTRYVAKEIVLENDGDDDDDDDVNLYRRNAPELEDGDASNSPPRVKKTNKALLNDRNYANNNNNSFYRNGNVAPPSHNNNNHNNSSKDHREDMAANEVAVLSRLNHPNVIKYFGSIHDLHILYILTDYADAGDLKRWIRKRREHKLGPFSEADVVHWIGQVILGLKYVHGCGLMHRDIKAANIFVTQKNTIKIGDFGLTRIFTHSNPQALSVCGTPAYYAPELCAREPYSCKADIWSAGVLLYETMALEHPFAGDDKADVLKRIASNSYKPVEKAVTKQLHNNNSGASSVYSNDLLCLLNGMMTHDHHKRPSADDLLSYPVIVRWLQTVEANGSGFGFMPLPAIRMPRKEKKSEAEKQDGASPRLATGHEKPSENGHKSRNVMDDVDALHDAETVATFAKKREEKAASEDVAEGSPRTTIEQKQQQQQEHLQQLLRSIQNNDARERVGALAQQYANPSSKKKQQVGTSEEDKDDAGAAPQLTLGVALSLVVAPSPPVTPSSRSTPPPASTTPNGNSFGGASNGTSAGGDGPSGVATPPLRGTLRPAAAAAMRQSNANVGSASKNQPQTTIVVRRGSAQSSRRGLLPQQQQQQVPNLWGRRVPANNGGAPSASALRLTSPLLSPHSRPPQLQQQAQHFNTTGGAAAAALPISTASSGASPSPSPSYHTQQQQQQQQQRPRVTSAEAAAPGTPNRILSREQLHQQIRQRTGLRTGIGTGYCRSANAGAPVLPQSQQKPQQQRRVATAQTSSGSSYRLEVNDCSNSGNGGKAKMQSLQKSTQHEQRLGISNNNNNSNNTGFASGASTPLQLRSPTTPMSEFPSSYAGSEDEDNNNDNHRDEGALTSLLPPFSPTQFVHDALVFANAAAATATTAASEEEQKKGEDEETETQNEDDSTTTPAKKRTKEQERAALVGTYHQHATEGIKPMDRSQFDAWVTRTIDDNATRRSIRQLISSITSRDAASDASDEKKEEEDEDAGPSVEERCRVFDQVVLLLHSHAHQCSPAAHMTLLSLLFTRQQIFQ